MEEQAHGQCQDGKKREDLWAGAAGSDRPPAMHVRLCVYFSGLREHRILRRG